ncbi:MAG: hypothetical protein ACLPIC_16715 [Rhodoblastus sp.]|uniref:hypothetical protein n=1 Tax=Rhodoblastus sp. TaxID=1962975 RepID=UPI003F9725CA
MKILNIAFGAILGLASFASANAQASVYTVDALTAFPGWLDTGLDLNSAKTYDFTVLNPSRTWSAGGGDWRTSTAIGITDFAQLTMGGFTANYGALVGDAGGTLFLIGTGTTQKGLSGELTVGYWDSFYPDNSGFQRLSVSSVVPEISTWAMMLAGFAGLGFAGYRRNKAAALAA